MEEIEVRSVLVADEDGVFIVAFEASANEGLIFQLADRIEHQDSMLGMDSYSLSTASGATMYGGVTDATADDSVLVLTLTDEAADTLGLPDTVRLRLSDEAEIGVAVTGLRQIGINVRNA
ncbi:MAG TPA: Imm10 family immunity protein [Gemmatimonadales bacterium]|nr:Imm10 family immunity protein [Gemmatimonadales bacterium]